MSKSNCSPTDKGQLLIFLSLVDEYDEMTSMLTVGDAEKTRLRVWALRAVLLRKFAAKGDNIYLERVTDALERLCPGSVPHGWATERLNTVEKGEGIALVRGNVAVGHWDVVVEDLYGTHMHGDYEKWHRSRQVGTQMRAVALMMWVSRLENVIHELRDVIQANVRDGLVLGDPPQPNGPPI